MELLLSISLLSAFTYLLVSVATRLPKRYSLVGGYQWRGVAYPAIGSISRGVAFTAAGFGVATSVLVVLAGLGVVAALVAGTLSFVLLISGWTDAYERRAPADMAWAMVAVGAIGLATSVLVGSFASFFLVVSVIFAALGVLFLVLTLAGAGVGASDYRYMLAFAAGVWALGPASLVTVAVFPLILFIVAGVCVARRKKTSSRGGVPLVTVLAYTWAVSLVGLAALSFAAV